MSKERVPRDLRDLASIARDQGLLITLTGRKLAAAPIPPAALVLTACGGPKASPATNTTTTTTTAPVSAGPTAGDVTFSVTGDGSGFVGDSGTTGAADGGALAAHTYQWSDSLPYVSPTLAPGGPTAYSMSATFYSASGSNSCSITVGGKRSQRTRLMAISGRDLTTLTRIQSGRAR
jgi:hypothetical protein